MGETEKVPEIPRCGEPMEDACLILNEILGDGYNYDPSLLFPKITAATLLLVGTPNFELLPVSKDERLMLGKDFSITIDKSKSIAKDKLKNSKFIKIKNAEHSVFKDQPFLTASKILSFIKNDN